MGGLEMGTDGILRCRSGLDCPNITTAKKYKEDAEKYRNQPEIVTLTLKYREIVERLKKFFNEDNVLTKQEYNQKILGEEK